MNRISIFLGAVLIAMVACGPGSVTTKPAIVIVTTFVDEGGKGVLPSPYLPLPNTLVIAKWNIHGNMSRDVKLTDQNGQANFSVSYTHIFDVSVLPPCGYYSTTPLFQDVTGKEKTEFGFWPANPSGLLSTVKVFLWKDLNLNGTRDLEEAVINEKASIMFNVPGGNPGNVFNQDNFIQESDRGWFDLNLGNSCGIIYVLLLNTALETNSVSEPGKVSDAGAHGNTLYSSIEIPYGTGETTVYWEIK
jgi:hypothetical protein